MWVSKGGQGRRQGEEIRKTGLFKAQPRKTVSPRSSDITQGRDDVSDCGVLFLHSDMMSFSFLP